MILILLCTAFFSFGELPQVLQAVLEKAQETLGRQNLGTVGLEAAKVQLSELVSKVSTQCLNSAFSELKELQGFCPQQTQVTQPADCSIDSCLTYCEGSQRDQEIHNNALGLRPYHGNSLLDKKEREQEAMLHQTELKWSQDLKENNKMFFAAIGSKDTERRISYAERHSSDLSMSMSVGLQVEKGRGSEGRFRGRKEDDIFGDQSNGRTESGKIDNERLSEGYELPYLATKLDLNARDETDAASNCKHFDLNGFGWG